MTDRLIFLTHAKGWLCIGEEFGLRDEPVLRTVYYPIMRAPKRRWEILLDTVVVPHTDVPWVYDIPITPRARRSWMNKAFITLALCDGCNTQPIQREDRKWPCPNVYHGKPKRYQGYCWQKLIASNWTDIKTATILDEHLRRKRNLAAVQVVAVKPA